MMVMPTLNPVVNGIFRSRFVIGDDDDVCMLDGEDNDDDNDIGVGVYAFGFGGRQLTPHGKR